ncbi:hypothetical protein V6B14_08540 [Sporosarcina psychrophila]|uniref:hypothetical protein n=1 Tax=Sporosarcina psychrophila TaxID=1476 RepID=UPI0030D13917
MQKLVKQLSKLLGEGKVELIDFDELTGSYSREKVSAVDKLLNELGQAGLLSYIREDYGFRIHVTSIDKLLEYKQ